MKTIYLTAAQARSFADGRKTQHRVVVKPQPIVRDPIAGEPGLEWHSKRYDNGDGVNYFHTNESAALRLMLKACPFGQPGDRLQFLAPWAISSEFDSVPSHQLKKYLPSTLWMWSYHDSEAPTKLSGKIRAARTMPTLLRERMPTRELVSVRVQRVQDITPDDCRAEGQPRGNNDIGVRYCFGQYWNATHPGSWERNDYVWVLEWRGEK